MNQSVHSHESIPELDEEFMDLKEIKEFRSIPSKQYDFEEVTRHT